MYEVIDRYPKVIHLAPMTISKIANYIPCAKGSLRFYLCRPEFAHIERIRAGREFVYKNITNLDLEELRKLFNRRPAHWGDRYAK